jgi:DNA processing protein
MDAVATQLILGRAHGLSAQRLQIALAHCCGGEHHAPGLTSVAALIGERPALLESLGLSPAISAWLHAPDRTLIDADREWIVRERIGLLDALSPGYPPLLSHGSSTPPVLYVRGNATRLCDPQLAIVGSRTPTTPGRRTAAEFAIGLSRAGLTITSGLAVGIDAASHEGALQSGGRTIAVLGSALDQIYPPQHGLLAARIASHGALVSEFPRGSPPLRSNFPRRNRLISGLSLGTLVVEATCHSGSLITAQFARQHGRRVFAVPGSIHNPLTRGCHALIRDGAKLVECPQDVFDEIVPSQKQGDISGIERRAEGGVEASSLDNGHKILLDALGFESASIDTLVERTGFPSQSVASMLLILELQGAVGPEAGGRYVKL